MKYCEHCENSQNCRVPTEGIQLQCRGRSVLSSNIRQFRTDAGLTQKELAQRAGIDRSYLARMEAESLNVSVNVVFAIAKVLNIEPWELLNPRSAA